MGAPGLLDPKPLYRHLDRLFARVDAAEPSRLVVPAVLGEAFAALSSDLGLAAGWLYGERRDGFELVATMGGEALAVPATLDAAQAPLGRVLQHGVYLFDGAEALSGPFAPTAALSVGTRPHRHVLYLAAEPGPVRAELDFVLNTLRAALGSRLQDDRVRGNLRQAAEIQRSLLLDEPPAFAGYELAARSIATEEVGGDFYDFLPSPAADQMGVAIGDASGHGLPAALLVRDVVTGLRMGMERELKAAHVFTKLNRVIHRSNLSSRFVSVFYGELADDGHLLYVNAGHPAGLVFSDGRVSELSAGGTVIGPLAEVHYRSGVAHLAPGDVLVLTTDGILERRDAAGEFFGDRLRESVRTRTALPAGAILDGIFADAGAFGGAHPFDDDATVVVVRRASGAPAR